MGIHDRGWYRDEGGRWGGAGEHRGVILLIAVTVACTVVSFAAPHAPRAVAVANGEPVEVPVSVLEDALDFHPPKVLRHFQAWRFATSEFVHASAIGLIFGMFGLYFFGGEMEILYGTGRFVAFYLLAGVIPNAAKLLLALAGVGADAHTAGASAPLAATFVLFVFHDPHRPIRLWLLPPIPAWVLVTVYLAVSVLTLAAALGSRNGDGIAAVLDPLVGAAVGFAYFRTRGRVFGLPTGSGRRERRRTSPANLKAFDPDAPRPTARPAAAAGGAPTRRRRGGRAPGGEAGRGAGEGGPARPRQPDGGGERGAPPGERGVQEEAAVGGGVNPARGFLPVAVRPEGCFYLTPRRDRVKCGVSQRPRRFSPYSPRPGPKSTRRTTTMQRCFCDVCGKEVGGGADARYAVRMESRRVGGAPAALTDADLDGQDDPDHLDAMEELLADRDADDGCDADEANPPAPPPDREYDLCGRCYGRFAADPFGRRRRTLTHSAN